MIAHPEIPMTMVGSLVPSFTIHQLWDEVLSKRSSNCNCCRIGTPLSLTRFINGSSPRELIAKKIKSLLFSSTKLTICMFTDELGLPKFHQKIYNLCVLSRNFKEKSKVPFFPSKNWSPTIFTFNTNGLTSHFLILNKKKKRNYYIKI